MLSEARVLLGIPPHPLLPLVREDFFDGDSYVVAMDWVDGIDLAKLLRDRGRPGLAPWSVLAYLSDAAAALTHLHGLKPAGDPRRRQARQPDPDPGRRVKLVDFGFSSSPWNLARHAGTPGFRAPELASLDDPSRASDVYALAASAFALLTGSAPAGLLPSWRAWTAPGRSSSRPRSAWDWRPIPIAGRRPRRARRATPGGLGRFAAERGGDVLRLGYRWGGRAVGIEHARNGSSAGALRRGGRRRDRRARGPARRVGRKGDETVSVFDGATSAVAAALDETARWRRSGGPRRWRSARGSRCTRARRSVAATATSA